MNPLNVAQIEREIESLLIEYPELAEDERLRADMIEGETETKAVLNKIVDRMRYAETMVSAIRQRSQDLDARQKLFERRASAMRAFAFRIMTAAQVKTMPLTEATLSIRVVPASVMVSDESQIPSEFKKVKTEPDRTKIKEALQAGQEVPGAYLTNGGSSLSVRVK